MWSSSTSSSSSGYPTSMNTSNSSFDYAYPPTNPYLTSTPSTTKMPAHSDSLFPTSPVICMYDNSSNIYYSNTVDTYSSPSSPNNCLQRSSPLCSYSSYPHTYQSFYSCTSPSSISPSSTPNPIVYPTSNVIQFPDYFTPPYPLSSTTSDYSDIITDNSNRSDLIPPTGRRRRQRTNYTKDQIRALEKVFQSQQYPDVHDREDLSKRLDIPESRIQVWFKNRRSRLRAIKTPHTVPSSDTQN